MMAPSGALPWACSRRLAQQQHQGPLSIFVGFLTRCTILARDAGAPESLLGAWPPTRRLTCLLAEVLVCASPPSRRLPRLDLPATTTNARQIQQKQPWRCDTSKVNGSEKAVDAEGPTFLTAFTSSRQGIDINSTEQQWPSVSVGKLWARAH